MADGHLYQHPQGWPQSASQWDVQQQRFWIEAPGREFKEAWAPWTCHPLEVGDPQSKTLLPQELCHAEKPKPYRKILEWPSEASVPILVPWCVTILKLLNHSGLLFPQWLNKTVIQRPVTEFHPILTSHVSISEEGKEHSCMNLTTHFTSNQLSHSAISSTNIDWTFIICKCSSGLQKWKKKRDKIWSILEKNKREWGEPGIGEKGFHFSRVLGKGLPERMTLEWKPGEIKGASQADMWGKHAPGRGGSKCKCPEVAACLTCSSHHREVCSQCGCRGWVKETATGAELGK